MLSHTRAIHWILLTNDLKRVEPTRKLHEFGFIGWIRQNRKNGKSSETFLEKNRSEFRINRPSQKTIFFITRKF